MKRTFIPCVCLAWTAMSMFTAVASAQVGVDGSGPSGLYADESRMLDPFARPRSQPSRTIGINPAARQALATTQPAAIATQPPPALTSSVQNTLNYFGGQAARQTLSQMPQQRRFVSQGGSQVGVGAKNKPYAGAASAPTISPYLNLFRDETNDALPNYFTFVRPYNRQIEANRSQRRQLQTLQRQVQHTAYQAPATGAMPATGVRARFGDTGQYYSGSGWKQ